MSARITPHVPVFRGVISRQMPTIIAGELVTLRAQGPWWAPQLHQAMEASAQQLADRFPWATPLPTEEACRRRGEQTQAQFESGEAFAYVIIENASNQVVGVIDLQGGLQRHVGYWIRTDRWGRGLATDACRTLVGQAFKSLDGTSRLWLRCDAANLASARVAHRLGFQLMTSRTTSVLCRAWTDRQMVWSLTRRNWELGMSVLVEPAHGQTDLAQLGHPELLRTLMRAQSEGEGQLLVAYHQQRPAGVVWVGRSTRRAGASGICHISDLGVHTPDRHMSVACGLMLAAESWASQAGAPAVWVRSPQTDRTIARVLYHALGYADNELGLGDGQWTDAAGRGHPGTAYCLVKRLRGAQEVHPAGNT